VGALACHERITLWCQTSCSSVCAFEESGVGGHENWLLPEGSGWTAVDVDCGCGVAVGATWPLVQLVITVAAVTNARPETIRE
jgi:hypothetical protein